MVRVLNMQTRPYYAQVALFDPTVQGSYPDWGSGEEEAIGARNGVAVATRPDYVGLVSIEVWIGSASQGRDLRPVLEANVTVVGSDGVLVGSVTGNDLRPVAIRPGSHRLQVLVGGPPGEVDRVSFEFTSLD